MSLIVTPLAHADQVVTLIQKLLTQNNGNWQPKPCNLNNYNLLFALGSTTVGAFTLTKTTGAGVVTSGGGNWVVNKVPGKKKYILGLNFTSTLSGFKTTYQLEIKSISSTMLYIQDIQDGNKVRIYKPV